MGRNEAHPAVGHGAHRLLGQGLHADEPLRREIRLDHRIAPLTAPDVVQVLLHRHQVAARLQVFDHDPPGLETIQPAVFFRHVVVHPPLLVHDDQGRKSGPAGHLEIVGVVGRGDLHGPGAEVLLDEPIHDDRQLPPHQREDDGPADHTLVALVVGVNRDAGVPQHRLGSGGGDLDASTASGERIAQGVQVTMRLLRDHLQVGDRRAAAGTPVDDELVPVNQPGLVKPDEGLAHGARQPRIHGESLAGPVAGAAEPFELRDDHATILLPPLPHALDEGLPAHRLAAQPFGGDLAIDHHLRRDPRVVRSGKPQHIVALHAPPARQDVLQRVVQRVSHVQASGDVWRRDHHGERRERRVGSGREHPELEPVGVPAIFDRSGLECALEIHRISGNGVRSGSGLTIKKQAVGLLIPGSSPGATGGRS